MLSTELGCVQSTCIKTALDAVRSGVVFLALLVGKIGFPHPYRTQLGRFVCSGKYSCIYFAPLSQGISLSGILMGFSSLLGFNMTVLCVILLQDDLLDNVKKQFLVCF